MYVCTYLVKLTRQQEGKERDVWIHPMFLMTCPSRYDMI